MANNNSEANVMLAIYGGKAFLKVKQCLENGFNRILFSFVSSENPKNHIDCYLLAEDFGILMKDVENYSLYKKIQAEKSKGEQYPKAIWTSPIGGNATGNNGKPVSRYFEISPASKGDILFTAYSYPADENDTGAFISQKGAKPLFSPLRVPCTYKDLRVLQYKWSFLEKDYMSQKYSLVNMKSDYTPNNAEDIQAETVVNIEEESTSIEQTAVATYDEEYDYGYDVKSESAVKTEPIKETGYTQRISKIEALSVRDIKPTIKELKIRENGEEKSIYIRTDNFTDQRTLSAFFDNLKNCNGKALKLTATICSFKGNDYLNRIA